MYLIRDLILTTAQNVFISIANERLERLRKKRKRYIYRLDIKEEFKKYKKVDERFISVRITRLFFFLFKDFQFRKLFRKATKLDGNVESNYCYLLEGRLSAIVYRTNLLTNPFLIIKFIKENSIYIGTRLICKYYYLVPVGIFLSFRKNILFGLLFSFIRRLRFKIITFTMPKYIFFCYDFNFLYLYRHPSKRDLVHPIAVDTQRLTGYY